MDTRVKERLVGAAVLVGIIVALVPEMLSGPRHDSPAPTSGDQVRTYTIDLSRDPGAGRPPREVLPSEAPVVTPAPPPEGALPEETAAQVTDPDASGTPPSAPVNEPAIQASGTAETSATAEGRAEAPKPVSRPPASAATSQSQSQSRESPAVDSGWAVQLGSFASRDNAERLARKLRERGYRAFVSHVGSGTAARHRVRVGPEQDRSRAEALAQRLRREGEPVSIVAHP